MRRIIGVLGPFRAGGSACVRGECRIGPVQGQIVAEPRVPSEPSMFGHEAREPFEFG
jgi:hypothetical protein